MKNSPSLFNTWKNKADTSDTLPLNNGANSVALFDVDISEPIASLDLLFLGRLQNANGSTDGATAYERALRQYKIQIWIERENGNLDIIQSDTPLLQFYNAQKRALALMNQSGVPGGFANQAVSGHSGLSYLEVTGAQSNAPEDFAIHVPVIFGFLGGANLEYQTGVFVPRPEFRSMKVQITCITANGGGVVTSRLYPFPSSDRQYSYSAYGSNTGNASVQIFVNKMDATKLNMNIAGRVVPLWRRKTLGANGSLGIPPGAGVTQGYVLDKWDRGIMWQAAHIFEENVVTATGATTVRNLLTNANVTTTQTILRDMILFANSTRLSEWNVALEALRTNTRTSISANAQTIKDAGPITIMFTKLGSFDSLADLRRYFVENDNVILQFDNVQDPTTGNSLEWIDVFMQGYQDLGALGSAGQNK